MTPAPASSLLSLPESRTLEFKRDLSSLQPILKTLVAFANTAGGTLIIGRADDGTLVGVPEPAKAEEKLANAISTGIKPALLPDIQVVRAEGKDLLVLRVAHLPGPFYLVASGPETGVYVRLGTTSRPADAAQRAEMRRIAQTVAFDGQPCHGTTLDDLDLDAARRAFAGVRRELDDAKLVGIGILVRSGGGLVPSNAGMILFGRPEPRLRHFPNTEIRCARFLGVGKEEFLDRLDVEGTPLVALDEVPRFVRRNTRLAGRITGMRRRDLPEYPPVAFREALVNAIAHTDYTLSGARIRIAIYSDRLEVENPGSLPFGITIEDFKAGVSYLRNPVIARVLRELGHMEEWGSGYRRIRLDCEAGGYALPAWTDLGTVVRVAFPPHPEVSDAAVLGRETVDDDTDEGEDIADSVPGDSTGETGEHVNGAHEHANEGVAGPNEHVIEGTTGPDEHVDEARIATLPARQRWILGQVAAGARLTTSVVVDHFAVSRATAVRDIAILRSLGLIAFEGPPKIGRYVLVKAP